MILNGRNGFYLFLLVSEVLVVPLSRLGSAQLYKRVFWGLTPEDGD